MVIQIIPTPEQIEEWIKAYVPEKEIFFLKEEDLPLFEEELRDVLVIPRDEFFSHKSYQTIQLINSYEFWQLSQEAAFAVIAPPSWVMDLKAAKRKELLALQVELNRGLMLPQSLFLTEDLIPEAFKVSSNGEAFVILQKALWDELPVSEKESLLIKWANEWETAESEPIPDFAPEHIKKFAASYPSFGGSNCLSTTLFAFTGAEWLIDEWVHPETFKHSLKRSNLVRVEGEPSKGDVVTWVNEAGVIQHASYCLGNGLFFNKNGQTFFNPYKILKWEDLKEHWRAYQSHLYRVK
ncbi:hypothetical protein PU629_08585 [Pullulanibacillus sp. KACC 23026]|uniref:hypothetical protein n=1 Tax=Pullulanibacillus sp. KACC 23026 TaxID=3028315 RepID=UPI0023AFD2AB|nr:hypothetical protein [Pullulanibacillus sp. KACC 23026]WEG14397.1 hypothetical protein PU629_08585 [Pullulanibacillus sp. KACC 23026]